MATCGCKRSPTGKCIGWHSLSEAEYLAKRAQYDNRKQLEAKDADSKQARKKL
jgi:hypothetical protein